MATSKEERSVLDCPICWEKLSNPKYLPCLHTFCELCIQSVIDSSISDCIVNRRNISFDCPVCRRVNQAPSQNISAKEWAEQLPKNHLLLFIKESYEKVLCDSCKEKEKKTIATLRCQQCRDNLCKSCCKLIHDRVKAYGLHTFVDLTSSYKEKDTSIEHGNCLVHTDKQIEVYCLDHGGLGCSYCLTTVHKECKTVLSLDEMADNDLENNTKSFRKETKEMRELTKLSILDTTENLKELDEKKNDILKSVAKNIGSIKQRLDFLHSRFQCSVKSTYKKETAELSSVLKALEDFDATLAQNENIVSTVMQRGTKKQMVITIEKIKPRLYDHLESMKAKKQDFKRSKVKWTYLDEVEKLNHLTKLGELERIIEKYDFVTPIMERYNAMERGGNLREIGIIIL